MADIIRPTFGTKPEEPNADHWHSAEEIGRAANYLIGLVPETTDQGPIIRVVIGAFGSDLITSVGVHPNDLGADLDTRACAQAVLMCMEIMSGDCGVRAA